MRSTDKETIKALECCVLYKQICPETCPMVNVRQCKVDLRKSTLDLINRQKAENERLLQKLQQAQKQKDKLMDAQMLLAKTSDEQQAEIEEQQSEIAILKDSNINLQELYYAEREKVKKAKSKVIDICKALKAAKTEARKEFAERLLSCYEGFDETNEVILFENLVKAIEDTKKEMESEKI